MVINKDLNNFGIVPKKSKDEVSARTDSDDHCYMAGKKCAMMGLPRDSGVEYSNEREKDLFNMGYSSGEWHYDRKIHNDTRLNRNADDVASR